MRPHMWLELVSLFPPTYHDRPNGNRIDLMEKLAAMHPKFLRFPGGNYLEGRSHRRAFRLETDHRPDGGSADSSRPVGLSFLRRHGAAGIPRMVRGPADGAGAGCLCRLLAVPGARKPGPELEPYVQDALDEIEYVTGGLDTKWGEVRAQNGHPAPFTLHTWRSAMRITSTIPKSYEAATSSSTRPSRRSIPTSS